jgi:hypothetical protein
MARQFKGPINLDVRDLPPDWDAFLADRAPEGAPMARDRDHGGR